MRSFMDENFLLKTRTAQKLYHDYAANMPIIDYHCHINPREIYEDRSFSNLTQVWLEGDHYKWRAMRSNGVPEEHITGNAPDRDKFQKYAKTLDKAIGNPLYHWSHLELKRYFNINIPLSGKTADEIWNLSSERLSSDKLSARSIIKQSNVTAIGTTDDPTDTLEWHEKIKNDPECDVTVIPTFRPDKAVNIDKPGFAEYIKQLGKSAEIEITSIEDLKAALVKRLDYFVSMGCRTSDHGLDYIAYRPDEENESGEIFTKALRGKEISRKDAERYKTELMLFLGRELAKRNLVMQLHYGVIRNTNTAAFNNLGADTGFDCINTYECSGQLVQFLNALEETRELPRTIIYSLNPNDNSMLDTIIGCFQGTEIAGKLQHGSAWWFNDTLNGMREHLKSLASLSLFGNFIGMLTDSRSFLSYTRHEYFRRILCDMLGDWVENGEYPDDIEALGKLVQDISYNNAKRYFNL